MTSASFMKAFFSALLVCSALPLFAQTDDNGWLLRKEENGITVYTRNTDSSAFDEFKATTAVYNIPIDSLYALLRNDKRVAANDPNVKRVEILKKVSEEEYFVRYELHLPIFLKDRDVVYQVNARATAKGYYIDGKSVPDYLPPRPGLVRMGEGRTITYLARREDGGVDVVLSGKLDLAGDVPEKIINKGLVISTYDRLAYIRSQFSTILAAQPTDTPK